MPVKIISKLQQVNDESLGKKPSFYLLDAKDIQFDITDGDGKPGDNNDLYTVITNLKNAVSVIPKFEIIICDELPTTGINPAGLYLVRNTESATNNLYTEYVYKNNDWEVLGIRKSEITNMVTTNTDQEINSIKTFNKPIVLIGNDDNGIIYPNVNDSGSIGTASQHFKQSYINNIKSNTILPILVDGSSAGTSIGSIGSSLNSWLNAYIDNIITKTLNATEIKENNKLLSEIYSDVEHNHDTVYSKLGHVHKLSEISNLKLDSSIVKTLDGDNEVLSVNTGYTTSGKNYAVRSDNGKLYVNVPWTDTVYTHPTYTTRTSGLYKITVDDTGHVSSVISATSSDIANLGVKITDTTYSNGTGLNLSGTVFSLKTASSSQLGGVKIGSNVNVDTNGVISVDLSPYALQTSLDASNSKISAIETKIGKYLDGTDTSLDQMSEVVAYIKNNKNFIDSIPVELLNVTATAAELNILDGATITTTELNYLDGVTSNIQTQLDGKAPSHDHTAYLLLAGGNMTGTLQLKGVKALSSSSSTTYSLGSSGQVLKSNGSAVYWAADNNTTYTFTNNGATLSWGATTTIATVGGVNITVTMPANPDTNDNDQNFNTMILASSATSTTEVSSATANPYLVLREKLTSSGTNSAVDSIRMYAGNGMSISGNGSTLTFTSTYATYDADTETLIINMP